MGINGNAAEWVKSFLTDRKQYVTIKDETSEVLSIECGVPQGSTLGPILFLLFINDFVTLPLVGQPYLFADDVALLYSTSLNADIQVVMNNDLLLIADWLDQNKILLNVSKTKYMQFCKSYPIDVFYKGELLEEVSEFSYLGLLLDNQLKFTKHADLVERKLSTIAGLFRRISVYLKNETKRMIYFALFQSRLIYGIAVWGTVCKTKISALQTIQNKAIKNLYSLERRTSTKWIHEHYNFLTIDLIYEHKLLIITHNIIKREVHTKVTFLHNHNTHGYGTRTKTHLHIHKMHPNSIRYKSIVTYNKLPDKLKEASKNQFKKISREYVVNKL